MSDSSEDEVVSLDFPPSISLHHNPTAGYFSYAELIDQALKQYQDIDEDELDVLQCNQNPFQHTSHLSQIYMHNNHHTLVPIGGNFQVVVPPILTEEAYKVKSAEMMKNLKILKINDPQEGKIFYNKHFELIETRFGPGRTYEDVNMLRNAFNRMNSKLSFEEYLNKNSKYWESFFKTKDRNTMPKPVVKKKKKKGTIPI